MSFYGHVWLHVKVFDKALLKYPAAVQPFVEGTLGSFYGHVWSYVWSHEILTYY